MYDIVCIYIYVQNGNCIVHDMFGHEVVEKIKEEYCDAFLTAHFEVPGEMFSLSMEAKTRGMGVVGSTQNILDFIKYHLKQALDRNVDDHLQFVLGTESGMITSIVAAVRQLFDSYESSKEGASIEVEIVFPVSSDAISKTSIDDSHHFGSSVANDLEQISIVPGVFSGEGCSIHGGCASCPYMKVWLLPFLLLIICDLTFNEFNIISINLFCHSHKFILLSILMFCPLLDYVHLELLKYSYEQVRCRLLFVLVM